MAEKIPLDDMTKLETLVEMPILGRFIIRESGNALKLITWMVQIVQ